MYMIYSLVFWESARLTGSPSNVWKTHLHGTDFFSVGFIQVNKRTWMPGAEPPGFYNMTFVGGNPYT